MRFAEDKFRLGTKPDGRYDIAKDPDSGVWVLDILVTRESALALDTHHTEIEVHIPGEWVEGRFLIPGRRYLLEWWRKNLDFEPDSQWEIWTQNHSMHDSVLEKARNPSIAIISSREAESSLVIRADSHPISFRKEDGTWSYTRKEVFPIGRSTTDEWELWQMEVVYDHQAGALHLWRNGELVHSEEGKPIGYNDRRGPPWSIGIYKFFRKVETPQRQAQIGPIRVQLLD